MYTFTLPYERQGYSQFGETGIIELMLSGLRDPHQTFVEIGFGTGNQNMTMDLLDQGYRGVGVDVLVDVLIRTWRLLISRRNIHTTDFRTL